MIILLYARVVGLVYILLNNVFFGGVLYVAVERANANLRDM
jgi:hypothetical protein